MDYEEKYRKALETAKSLYGQLLVDNAILETIFPELKENKK